MKNRSSAQIRQDFLTFFEEKGHAVVDSAPVVPRNDSTLLFTNAGMNQFKPIFLDEQKGVKKNGKIWNRATDTQRCIRVSGKHNDLEEVGRDTYHHTLFEMLGNWSFGDYFKKEAIRWAWELLVDVWELDPGRLYATVFEGDESDGLPMDEEAATFWKSETGINPDHVLACGKKDNFWEMGDTGPCGPCSEVHIDLRSDDERAETPGADLVNKDHPRVMEIWNLVFIQFNRQPDGSLEKLPAQHVDTGMGFERMCAVLQGKNSNYDTDLFMPVLKKIEELSGISYKDDPETDIAMQVIADHIRAVSFSIADGASPDNEGRGFVVRRILRRAVRYGWDKLNLKKPFFHKIVPALAKQFEDVFPVLADQQKFVTSVIKSEEESFLNTLGQGIELFNEVAEGKETISGEDAFKLHDTYGFPIDLTELMARERGMEVDHEGFQQKMQEQKERARAAGNFKADQSGSKEWTTVHENLESRFVGYDQLAASTKIMAYRKSGDQPAVILAKTPFYAESGGQVADTGTITNGDQVMNVLDVQKNEQDFIHFVDELPADFSGEWKAEVDQYRRREIMKHHTATHLVHAALRETLGDHVVQKGSLVDEHHLRFDFSHYDPLSRDELDTIEKMVNDHIQENITRQEDRDVPIEKAKERGAMMLFGEKYGEKVRVITFNSDYSVELCGGTHVNATGEIGYFRFLNESSVASGVRRIEAVVGKAADAYLRKEKSVLQSIHQEIGQSKDPAADVHRLVEERKQLQKKIEQLQHRQSLSKLEELISGAEEVDGSILLVAGEVPHADMNLLKQLGYEALEKLPKGTIAILGAKDMEAGKVYIVATVTDDIIENKGIQAGALVGKLGQKLGGGGGGQPKLATAGGSKPEKLEEVLNDAAEIIKQQLAD
ncbi:MAG: alanine--tRNA ligase [Balneolaceae bacterium]|nr:alanine--tRNA ligase [Balneolaceae bacterium]